METVKQLNKQEFTTKVADIEKSKGEWKFLGERPAVIDFFATWTVGAYPAVHPAERDAADDDRRSPEERPEANYRRGSDG